MAVKQLMTAEELWAMPEAPGKLFELVDGELVEIAGVTAFHGFVAGALLGLLSAFARERNLGLAFPDNTAYVLRRSPDLVRIPGVSYVSWPRVPEGGIPEGFWEIAPDLAVEIVSPSDVAQEVYRKVHEYLDAGTRIVWVLWPTYRAITLYAEGGIVRDLGPEDVLEGGDVLPGFQVSVGELFERPRRP
jgi:Uma2 family endonuclease